MLGVFLHLNFHDLLKGILSWLLSNCIITLISLIITNYVTDVNMFSFIISWYNYNTQNDVMNILTKVVEKWKVNVQFVKLKNTSIPQLKIIFKKYI
jgi:hypothetical protein